MTDTRNLEPRTATQKGKQMDGFLSNLTGKMDVARKSLEGDQKELKKIDQEIIGIQANLEKSNAIIEQKRKLRDQAREQLMLLEDQFDLIKNQTKQLLLETHKRAAALRQGKRLFEETPEPLYTLPPVNHSDRSQSEDQQTQTETKLPAMKEEKKKKNVL